MFIGPVGIEKKDEYNKKLQRFFPVIFIIYTVSEAKTIENCEGKKYQLPDHFGSWSDISTFNIKHCKTLQLQRTKWREDNPSHPETRPRSHRKIMEGGREKYTSEIYGLFF